MRQVTWVMIILWLCGAGAQAEEPRPLHEVKTIYVRPMSNDLDQSLIQQLLKWDAIKVVDKPEEADAVLIGSSDMRIVGVGTITATRVQVEVTLLDPKAGKPIWSTKKGGGKGLLSLAEKVIQHLRKEWEKSAEKRKKTDG